MQGIAPFSPPPVFDENCWILQVFLLAKICWFFLLPALPSLCFLTASQHLYTLL
jgi:hypothetical protein